MTITLRKVVTIDEDLCNGCGVCIPACAEGALEIIGGKARLVDEVFCDGLGACLGECPQGAITIERRAAAEFDEQAAKRNLEKRLDTIDETPCRCPSTSVVGFATQGATGTGPRQQAEGHSALSNWPIQLALVPPAAPFLQGADLLLAADCVPFAFSGFHQEFLKDHALLVACPKLDNIQAHLAKLTDILAHSSAKSLRVMHMEVPCCSALAAMAKRAVALTGRAIPLEDVTIGIKGDVIRREEVGE